MLLPIPYSLFSEKIKLFFSSMYLHQCQDKIESNKQCGQFLISLQILKYQQGKFPGQTPIKLVLYSLIVSTEYKSPKNGCHCHCALSPSEKIGIYLCSANVRSYHRREIIEANGTYIDTFMPQY